LEEERTAAKDTLAKCGQSLEASTGALTCNKIIQYLIFLLAALTHARNLGQSLTDAAKLQETPLGMLFLLPLLFY